jgi:hypothetical protein
MVRINLGAQSAKAKVQVARVLPCARSYSARCDLNLCLKDGALTIRRMGPGAQGLLYLTGVLLGRLA